MKKNKNCIRFEFAFIRISLYVLFIFGTLKPIFGISKDIDYYSFMRTSKHIYFNNIGNSIFINGINTSFLLSEYSHSSITLFGMGLINNFYTNNNMDIANDTLEKRISDEYIKSLEKNKFSGGRTARWYYGWVIFKDYPWFKKLFGGGFEYMEMFGKKFGRVKYDYPHNPIISAFLYSGIIGGVCYICFLILSFWYYWKFREHHMIFFIMYLVTFFFVFFSSDSHFDTPIFAFLSIIPFFTRYLVTKEMNKSINNNDLDKSTL